MALSFYRNKIPFHFYDWGLLLDERYLKNVSHDWKGLQLTRFKKGDYDPPLIHKEAPRLAMLSKEWEEKGVDLMEHRLFSPLVKQGVRLAPEKLKFTL